MTQLWNKISSFIVIVASKFFMSNMKYVFENVFFKTTIGGGFI